MKQSERTIKIRNNHISTLREYVESEEYLDNSTWKESRVFRSYSYLMGVFGKGYMPVDLLIKINEINYFIYRVHHMGLLRKTKDNHFWCRHCEKQKKNGKVKRTVCVNCAKIKRGSYRFKENRVQKEKYQTNIPFKLYSVMKVHIGKSCRNLGLVRSKEYIDIIGISKKGFAEHIENNWEDWMNWENYGSGDNNWNLHHVIPRMKIKSEGDIYKLNYYMNIIPLGSSDNKRQGNKILDEQCNEYTKSLKFS